MPTSAYQNTVFVLDFLSSLEPKSVLDVGAGFGRWGYLCRCHIGGGQSLTAMPDQPLRIDAVEVFQKNISPVYEAVYNKTYFGNIEEVLPELGEYDAIICGDMIEHLPKDRAWKLILETKKHTAGVLILALPFGECRQGAVRGNEFETHRSTWTARDFRRTGAWVRSFPYARGVRIGVVIWPFSEHARWWVKMRRSALRRLLAPFLTSPLYGRLRRRFCKRRQGRNDPPLRGCPAV